MARLADYRLVARPMALSPASWKRTSAHSRHRRQVGQQRSGPTPTKGWQDLRHGTDGVWRHDDERGAFLVNSGRPMSPNTVAVHHILDAHVTDEPYWREVAAAVLRPEGGVAALAAHRAAFEQRYCRPSLTGGAGWICTWKCAFCPWPDLPRFSN